MFLSAQPHISLHTVADQSLRTPFLGSVSGGKEEALRKNKGSKQSKPTKVDTARGKRGGRLRLPLDIAQQFFAVHDKLGSSKPSQTIAWLLNNAASAIENMVDRSALAKHNTKRSQEEKRFRMSKLRHLQNKDSRRKARARARERMMEKKRPISFVWSDFSAEVPDKVGHSSISTTRYEFPNDGNCDGLSYAIWLKEERELFQLSESFLHDEVLQLSENFIDDEVPFKFAEV